MVLRVSSLVRDAQGGVDVDALVALAGKGQVRLAVALAHAGDDVDAKRPGKAAGEVETQGAQLGVGLLGGVEDLLGIVFGFAQDADGVDEVEMGAGFGPKAADGPEGDGALGGHGSGGVPAGGSRGALFTGGQSQRQPAAGHRADLDLRQVGALAVGRVLDGFGQGHGHLPVRSARLQLQGGRLAQAGVGHVQGIGLAGRREAVGGVWGRLAQGHGRGGVEGARREGDLARTQAQGAAGSADGGAGRLRRPQAGQEQQQAVVAGLGRGGGSRQGEQGGQKERAGQECGGQAFHGGLLGQRACGSMAASPVRVAP